MSSRILNRNSGITLPTVLVILITTSIMLMGVFEKFRTSFRTQATSAFDVEAGIVEGALNNIFSSSYMCTWAFTQGTPVKVEPGLFAGAALGQEFSFQSPTHGLIKQGGQAGPFSITGVTWDRLTKLADIGASSLYLLSMNVALSRISSSDMFTSSNALTLNYIMYVMGNTATGDFESCHGEYSAEAMCANTNGVFDQDPTAVPRCVARTMYVAKDASNQSGLPAAGVYGARYAQVGRNLHVGGTIYRKAIPVCQSNGTNCPQGIPKWHSCAYTPAVTGALGVRCATQDATETVTARCSTFFPGVMAMKRSVVGYEIQKDGTPVEGNHLIDYISKDENTVSVTHRADEVCNAGSQYKQLSITLRCCRFRIAERGG